MDTQHYLLIFFDSLATCVTSDLCDKTIAYSFFSRHAKIYGHYMSGFVEEIRVNNDDPMYGNGLAFFSANAGKD